jgi:cytochrome b6-f complex iron-sulfur subunit
VEKPRTSRRQFLATLASGVACLALLYRYLSPGRGKPARTVTLARADIPEEGALVYRQARLAVIRDNGALYALDLVCTHLGCTVAVTPTELVCPCHGSRFDRQGSVLAGPAVRPLKRYRVQADPDSISVFLT